MPDSTDIVVNGALKLLTNPDFLCYEDFKSFVLDFVNLFGVVIPNTVTNVIVSNVQPLDSQTNAVWFRTSNGGVFVGIYLYSSGTWIQRYPAPNEIQWIGGTAAVSTSPPAGYITTNDAPNSIISASLKSSLAALWHSNGAGAYDYFSVIPEPL